MPKARLRVKPLFHRFEPQRALTPLHLAYAVLKEPCTRLGVWPKPPCSWATNVAKVVGGRGRECHAVWLRAKQTRAPSRSGVRRAELISCGLCLERIPQYFNIKSQLHRKRLPLKFERSISWQPDAAVRHLHGARIKSWLKWRHTL